MPDHKFGAKLTLSQVQYVRANWGRQRRKFWKQLATQWGVLPITLRRVGEGKTWKEAYVEKRKEDSKQCVECGSFFFQCEPGKDRKSDARFARQRYCTTSCACKARWREGIYASSDFNPWRTAVGGEREANLGGRKRNSGHVCAGDAPEGRAGENVVSERDDDREAAVLPHVEIREDKEAAHRN